MKCKSAKCVGLFFGATLLTACSQDGFLSGIDYVNQPAAKDAYGVERYSLPDHIVVRPVAGLPRTDSDELAELTAEHLAQRELIATVAAPPQKTSRLTGWATPTDLATGKAAHIEYSLRNPDGSLRTTIEVPVEGDLFQTVELTGMERRAVLKRTAAATAERIYAFVVQSKLYARQQDRLTGQESRLPSQEQQMLLNPTQTKLKTAIPAVYIMPALGAPGDGLTSLPKAMSQTLQTYGIAISEKPGPDLLQLQCIVSLSSLGSAQQSISVSWELKSPSGDIIATIDQNNTIEDGSLDGPWDETALVVASAAAEGLVKALNQVNLSPARP